MTTIIVFASSLLVVSILVITKAVELGCGKKNAILGVLCHFDSKADKLIADLKFRGLQLIQSIRYILLVQARAVFRNLLEKVEEKIMNEYRAKHNTFMGRREIASKGSVSFYLKKITEDRSNGGKGRIE